MMDIHKIIRALSQWDPIYERITVDSQLEFRYNEIRDIMYDSCEDVFVGIEVEGKSYKSIVQQLGISAQRVRHLFNDYLLYTVYNSVTEEYIIQGGNAPFMQYLYENADSIALNNVPFHLGTARRELLKAGINTLGQLLDMSSDDLMRLHNMGPKRSEVVITLLDRIDPSRKLSGEFNEDCIYKVDPTKYGKLLFPNMKDMYHCRNWTFTCRKRGGVYYMTDTYFNDKSVAVTSDNEHAFIKLFQRSEYESVDRCKFNHYEESDRLGPVAMNSGGHRFPSYYVKRSASESRPVMIAQLQKELDAINSKRDFIISELFRLKAEEV